VPRVVLDTNVLVSAVLTPGGIPDRILADWRDGGFDLIISPSLLTELERVLSSRKLATPEHSVAALFAQLQADALLVDDPTTIEPVIAADADDDFVVALARLAEADVIVTGDRHLLDLPALVPPVISPRAFLAALERTGGL
jgi:uncharacterized protein